LTADDRVVVVGRARGELAPDRVEWVLVVRETDSDPRAAFARCSDRLRGLAGTLAMAQVTTGAVTVAELRSPRRPDAPSEPTGKHEARAALTAIAPLDLGGEVAAAAMEAGADELHGPKLLTPDAAEAIDALGAQAVKAARRRAERMAEAAGRRVGRAVSIGDHQSFDDEFDDAVMVRRESAGGGGDGRPPVIPRPQVLVVSVRVVFELTD